MRNFPIRLASLDLIRGFVAVGRRMSITLAAEDLFLTQSAVSRQVIALEEALGVRLLNRGYRSIHFTAEGERFFRVADSALQQLQDVVNALAAGRDRRPVTITATIGVSGLWIMPRLGGFQQRHADIDLRVAASNKVMDLRTKVRISRFAIAPLRTRRRDRSISSAKRSRRSPILRSACGASTPNPSRDRSSSNTTTRTAPGCNGPTGSIPWV
jgi:DNA-binding transcriptional LysR family regulator